MRLMDNSFAAIADRAAGIARLLKEETLNDMVESSDDGQMA